MVFNEKGDSENAEFEMTLVNPVVTAQSEETDLEEEGCLSFPLILGKVYRNKWISVDYQDIKGEKKSLKLEGWPARLFQHEFDHLDKVSNRKCEKINGCLSLVKKCFNTIVKCDS
jgi:peptide deformylase